MRNARFALILAVILLVLTGASRHGACSGADPWTLEPAALLAIESANWHGGTVVASRARHCAARLAMSTRDDDDPTDIQPGIP